MNAEHHQLAQEYFNKNASLARKIAQSKALKILENDISTDQAFINHCLQL